MVQGNYGTLDSEHNLHPVTYTDSCCPLSNKITYLPLPHYWRGLSQQARDMYSRYGFKTEHAAS